ncbi:hypothetical protein GMOD_00002569 [Pyrenophora seminiperda CCB06]|uniref:Uncharacterized protein n=1 Tax=Pyrenophora seminiperda CCB06 TaxID=1302712 RepID=A0A3M7M2P3_9PLEO|nr:hypothetical protein GMOD_00002569 [Pyrenophora seminiperda CCB06]
MYLNAAALLAFAATSLAAPFSTLNATLLPRLNPNACPANEGHNLEALVYLNTMNYFCDRHTPTEIKKYDDPLVFTYDLTAYDGKPIRWVFKVGIDANTPGYKDSAIYGITLTNQLCKEKFAGFVQGKGGGMPKVYCEWNDDKGTRDHLVLGGSYRDGLAHVSAEVVWETRQRHDD